MLLIHSCLILPYTFAKALFRKFVTLVDCMECLSLKNFVVKISSFLKLIFIKLSSISIGCNSNQLHSKCTAKV